MKKFVLSFLFVLCGTVSVYAQYLDHNDDDWLFENEYYEIEIPLEASIEWQADGSGYATASWSSSVRLGSVVDVTPLKSIIGYNFVGFNSMEFTIPSRMHILSPYSFEIVLEDKDFSLGYKEYQSKYHAVNYKYQYHFIINLY